MADFPWMQLLSDDKLPGGFSMRDLQRAYDRALPPTQQALVARRRKVALLREKEEG